MKLGRTLFRLFTGSWVVLLFLHLSSIDAWSGELPEALTRGGIEGVPPPDGKTLAGILRSLVPKSDSSWKGTLTIRRRGAEPVSLPVTSRVIVSETNWSVTYSTPGNARQPAEALTVLCSTNAPNRYLRAVAAKPGTDSGETKPITTAEADTPFAGSDFLLSDLGLEFFHWPLQTRLRGELCRDRPCHVLESRREKASGEGYVSVTSWVDRESGGIIQAKAFGADGKLVKDFEVGSFKKVNGAWQLQDMEMVNRVTRSRSKIEFDLSQEQ
jgi:hypothetical protein